MLAIEQERGNLDRPTVVLSGRKGAVEHSKLAGVLYAMWRDGRVSASNASGRTPRCLRPDDTD